jgi:hypothetical protein
MIRKLLVIVAIASNLYAFAQHEEHHAQANQNIMTAVEPQPLLAQAVRLKDALSFLGSSLTKEDEKQLLSCNINHSPSKRRGACRKYSILIALLSSILILSQE